MGTESSQIASEIEDEELKIHYLEEIKMVTFPKKIKRLKIVQLSPEFIFY